MRLTWRDTDEIAWALMEHHPDQDPLQLSFPRLQRMVLDLEDFDDHPEGSSEAILESIQMTWHAEVR